MRRNRPMHYWPFLSVVGLGLLLCAGCETVQERMIHPSEGGLSGQWADNGGAVPEAVPVNAPGPLPGPPVAAELPHELHTTSLAPYVIEPPDVLLIDALQLVPKPPYHIGPLDIIGLQVTNTLPKEPIYGPYPVDPDGTINLGYNYGNIRALGLTLPELKAALIAHMKWHIQPPYEVTVVLVESKAPLQQVRGAHLVRPDGTIGLGTFGSVFVDGLTIDQARAAIENHLAQFVMKPQISVDVAGFNSKVYYVITDGAGNGESVTRFPVTGKGTILDALSQVNGLSPVSSKCFVYLVRPTDTACKKGGEAVYHIDYNAIVRRGDVATNYQVLPGDRIYVLGAPMLTANTYLNRFLTPVQNIFGAVGLGNGTVREFLTPIVFPNGSGGFVAP
jgi:polysaccharide biosynthesis/export protein